MSVTITPTAQLCNEPNSASPGSRRTPARLVQFLAIVGLLSSSSTSWAQIVTPEDGDYIGYWYNSVTVSGYTYDPDDTIVVQARHSSGSWQTIATTTAGSGWWGYGWSTSVVIPTSCWSYYGYNSIYEAEIRALRLYGWYGEQLGDSVTILGWSGGGS